MQLFYDFNINSIQSTHQIDSVESHHIIKVLRKKVGDHIFFTNGRGQLFKTEIIHSNNKYCEVKVLQRFDEKPLPYCLHIAIAPPKSSDRLEFFLEKATEIGVSEISLLRTKNSERKRVNIKRLEKIVQSAMKQSNRLYLPKLNDLINFDVFLKDIDKDSIRYIAHCEEQDKKNINTLKVKSNTYCILIGPEGDFTSSEIENAIKNQFSPVSLGEKRLRTETAGVLVASHFQLNASSF